MIAVFQKKENLFWDTFRKNFTNNLLREHNTPEVLLKNYKGKVYEIK